MSTLLGFSRLAARFDVLPVQPLSVRSELGPSRRAVHTDSEAVLTWTARYEPEDSFRGHFEFGLKYERIHLEFLSRLFEKIDPEELAAWVREEPTGAYARRTGFLFEWITGRRLPVPDTAQGGYVNAIDPDQYLVATKPVRNRRWRVNDNLPGVPAFCPMAWLGPAQQRDWLYDITAGVQALDDDFGPELLLRCAAWLTFKESRASFQIEREADKDDRIRRFAAAIGQHSGKIEDPLSGESLELLQRSILGDDALRLGLRKSPVFVGENALHGPVVHYIAPGFGQVDAMMEGLRAFERRTRGASSVVRTAALSFAFVYLHPLSDGNGRVHRFLVNDTLARDGAVPANVIVPVSATIAGSARGRAGYDEALEQFSRPFMRRYAGAYRFGARQVAEDGVEHDLVFEQEEDALHAWRFIDLTSQVRYLSAVLRDTVENEMTREATYLQQYERAKDAVKNLVEMPDLDADRIIRALRDNGWQVSGKLRKEYPVIFEPEGRLHRHASRLVEDVREAFASRAR